MKLKKDYLTAEVAKLDEQLKTKCATFLNSCPLVTQFHAESIEKTREYETKLEVYKKSRGIM